VGLRRYESIAPTLGFDSSPSAGTISQLFKDVVLCIRYSPRRTLVSFRVCHRQCQIPELLVQS